MKIFSFSPFGYEGALVSVEVDIRRGIPAVDVVGLADGAVKESRERMRSAIRNSGFEFPIERVLISLSPADLKKEGAGFDLALALAVLQEQKRRNGGDFSETIQSAHSEDVSPGDIHYSDEEKILVMGELELSGAIRPVRGIHAAAETALKAGITKCIIPENNYHEAAEIPGIRILAAGNLSRAFEGFFDDSLFKEKSTDEKQNSLPEKCVEIEGVYFPKADRNSDYIDVMGQEKLVRALQIAAAGGHNLLAFGPPGCGKTLSLLRFPQLLPLLTVEEAQSVTRIHSLAGILPVSKPLKRESPFRIPHQTASIEGMCGGGVNCRPGEISLAHNGVLFLDEAAEFRTSVLQMLRVPLESGEITLSRAGRSTVYPAKFQLLMASNPCPCGNFGVPGRICLCSAKSIELYWKKLSGPLIDRIDLRISVKPHSDDEIEEIRRNEERKPLSTAQLRIDIAHAVKIQRTKRGKKNAFLSPAETEEFCPLDDEELSFIKKESERREFSQRAINSCIKVARTIADMEDSEKITTEHLKEALSMREDVGIFSFAD